MKKKNRKIREKRKLIKHTIIGIVVLIVIQLCIIDTHLNEKYLYQQASSDDTYTETIYVDRVVYVKRKNRPRSIYVYSDDIRLNLYPNLARKHTKKSPDEICQSLEGSSLTVTYRRGTELIVDAHNEDIVYYTINEYNAYAEKKDQVGIVLLVILEFCYCLFASGWIFLIVVEWKLTVISSKNKKRKVVKESARS